MNINLLKRNILKFDIVSFDIFDTLLIRPYIKPTDLFLHMEKALNYPGFADERKDAERRARIRHSDLEDITFDMIYDEIDDEFKGMKQKEMDWEEMVLRANPEMKQVYDYAKAQGKKIVIASDMYLPTKFIAKVLKKNGYDAWDDLYVSSLSGKRKITGNLYRLVIEKYGAPDDILHIGDNKVSDYDEAKKLGMNVALYKQVINQYLDYNKAACKYVAEVASLGSSIILGTLAQHWQAKRCSGESSNYWQELGYNYCGPLAYAYARFIEKKAEQEDLNRLLFIARDGYILQKVFNTFNKTIKNEYIYAPRIVSMKCIGEYKNLADFTAEAILRDFAEQDEEIKFDVERVKDRTVNDWKKLFEKHRSKIKEIASHHMDDYKKYLSRLVKKNDRVACVDTSAAYWSAQRLIEKALTRKIFGLYFVVYYADGEIAKQEQFQTFSQEYLPLSKHVRTNINLFTKNWFFIEFLLSSPENAIHNVLPDGTIEYKQAKDEFEKNRAELYGEILKGALNFADDINSRFSCNPFFEYSDIIKHINAFMGNPSKEDIKAFQKVNFKWYPTNNDKDIPLFSQRIRLRDYIFHPFKVKRLLYSLMWKTKFQIFYLRKYFFYEIKSQSMHIKKLFGITIWAKKEFQNTQEKIKFFGLIREVKTPTLRKVYLCGIQVIHKERFCLEALQDYMSRIKMEIINSVIVRTQRALTVAALHQKTFGEFRNKHKGKSVVLIGAGPTVRFFKPLSKAIYVGINRVFLLDNIKFKYLFSIDKHGLDLGQENYQEGFFKYDCIKFIGDQNMGPEYQIPQSLGNGDSNVRRYKTTSNFSPANFALDIDTCALKNSASTSIQAMQFILFTNPKRVYVVGIDCTNSLKQHFVGGAYDNSLRNENVVENDRQHIQAWKDLKVFVNTYYPETEIIVVNPVGLRGIFRDAYTQEYLDKHPEIDQDGIEIIDEKGVQND